jgi:CRISPR-associated protein Csm4
VKIYEITIIPLTGLGTPMIGDSVFGTFCWQIANDDKLVGKKLDDLLSNYHTKPFVIFSSVYPKFLSNKVYNYAFKTPALPLETIFNLPANREEKITKRKEFKSKKWMLVAENQKISSIKELEKVNDTELFEKIKSSINNETRKQIKRSGTKSFSATLQQFHNKINRVTGKTGEEGFAPFSVFQEVYIPNMELSLFVGFDENSISIEQILTILQKIGDTGFGKDASIGLGKFKVGEETEIDLSKIGSDSPNALYTLSPSVPEKGIYQEIYFQPFTRFGKHGDMLAKSDNPFKNPVIMADEGAVLIPKEKGYLEKNYIGTAVSNLSKSMKETVAQGYSLVIPINVEV